MSAKCNEVSGHLNLAKIYLDNVLFQNQSDYIKSLQMCKNSSNESSLALALMNLTGNYGKLQDFHLAIEYLKKIKIEFNDPDTRKNINHNFYEGFN